jgi:small-conductance mechanosensitive channel
MEKEKLYTTLIILESLFFPFIIGMAGTGFIPIFISKVILIFLLIVVFFFMKKAIREIKLKHKRWITYQLIFFLVLCWNFIIIIPYLVFGFDLCPNCP